MEKINFEDGKLVKSSYVEINGEEHQVHEADNATFSICAK